MKYVIATHPFAGYPVPVVFAEEATHAYVAAALLGEKMTLNSAGFVDLVKEEWVVRDTVAVSLASAGVGPRASDQEILRYFLKKGLTGLSLFNVLAYNELKKAGEVMPLDCNCDKYRCPCHDKLRVAVQALARIVDGDPGPAYYIAKGALEKVCPLGNEVEDNTGEVP